MLVEDRIARQRPVNILVACRADHHVGEREARRQMEAKRPLLAHRPLAGADPDRQQVGELAPEHPRGRAFEIVGQLLRDIGQRPLRIGLPEPAAPAILELGDEAKRLLRVGVELQPAPCPGDHRPRARHRISDDHQRQRRNPEH